jgi:hypothetical protein
VSEWIEDGSGSLYCQPAKMEQNLELLKAMQEQMDDDQEEKKADMKTKKEMLARMEARTDINLKEMTEEMVARMEARTNINLMEMIEEMVARMEARTNINLK